MSEAALTLWGDSRLDSPWVFSAFVALEEKQLPYRFQTLSLKDGEHQRPEYRAPQRKVPALQHGDFWLAESSAIAEYLAEVFPFPGHPRLFPENLQQRGVCRMVQSWLRTDFGQVREERTSETLFYARTDAPLSAKAKAQADGLVRGLEGLIAQGRATLFEQWCIADCDLALMLMRLHRNAGYALPPKLQAYAEGAWQRPSIQKWVSLKRPER